MAVLLSEWLCTSFGDSVSKSEGIILNAHCVAVSVVNNDASASLLCIMFVAMYCQLGS